MFVGCLETKKKWCSISEYMQKQWLHPGADRLIILNAICYKLIKIIELISPKTGLLIVGVAR